MTDTRLGVIAPPTNTVNEKEWAKLLPEGVSMHFTRMALHADTDTPAGKQALHDDLATAMTLLRDQGATVMVYACTAGSMTLPHHALPDWMRDTAGMPAVTTAAVAGSRGRRSRRRRRQGRGHDGQLHPRVRRTPP